jgi:hypothetical protein
LAIGRDVTISDNFTAGNFIHTVGGNFYDFGTFICGTGTFTFNGANVQTIISGGDDFYDIIFNNSTFGFADIDVIDPMNITHSGTFTNGVVIISGLGTLTFVNGATSTSGSADSFVDGSVKKIGNVAFIFPIGDNSLYAPLEISAADGGGTATDDFIAKYINEDPHALYNSLDVGIHHVSYVEYWTLDRTGTNDVSVTLSWDTRSYGVTETASLIVAHWDGSKWLDVGNVSTTGDLSAGTITSDLLTSFSPFTLASKSSENTLPVSLLTFDAKCIGTASAQITWTCSSEVNNEYFTVERSTNHKTWDQIVKLKGAGNSNFLTEYSVIDNFEEISEKEIYYRLRQYDYDGKSEYFNVRNVTDCNDKELNDINLLVYPNPFRDEICISFNAFHSQIINIEITELTGKLVGKDSFVAEDGGNSYTINLSDLAPGIYMLRFNNGFKQVHKKIIKTQ